MDWEKATQRALLLFPDIYEIGMSNQGWKILYDRIFRAEGSLADRAFLPWPDMGDLMVASGVPLFSLDHRRPAKAFHLIGITISHELLYTNVLHSLFLSGISLFAKERGEEDPIIILGGTGVTNPLPMAPFADVIFLGDGEEAIVEMLSIVAASRKEGVSRREILLRLESVEGVLISPRLTGELPMRKATRRTFRSPVFGELSSVIVPSVAITQDRVVLEVARGCARGCRFCHAGFWKRPIRNSNVDLLIEQADRMLARSGADSISLHSLSLADYPDLEELVNRLSATYGPRGISLSLPSLRVDERTIPVLEATSGIRKSGVTFALEAGSEYLRERIKKGATESRLHSLVGQIFDRGWDLVKVYFMLGLPDESGNEVQDLIRSLQALGELAEQKGKKKFINATISLFVPKPHTTLQWSPLQTPEYFLNAFREIQKGVRSRRVSLKHPKVMMSYVEGVLSRAGRGASDLIYNAYKAGARFDSWDDHFRGDVWQSLIQELPEKELQCWIAPEPPDGHAITPSLPPCEKEMEEQLAYSSTVHLPEERYLLLDYRRFQSIKPSNATEKELSPAPGALEQSGDRQVNAVKMDPMRFQMKWRLLLIFDREGRAVYAGHLDTVDAIRKAARRVGLPMSFSEGFNKHERITMSEPIPLYFHSRYEWMLFDLFDSVDVEDYAARFKDQLPPGIHLQSLTLFDSSQAAHRAFPAPSFRYLLEFGKDEDANRALELLRNAPELLCIQRKRGGPARGSRGRGGGVQAVPGKGKEKRFAGAMRELKLEDQRKMVLELESTNSGAVSMSDILLEYLHIPVERWNVDVTITKLPPSIVVG